MPFAINGIWRSEVILSPGSHHSYSSRLYSLYPGFLSTLVLLPHLPQVHLLLHSHFVPTFFTIFILIIIHFIFSLQLSYSSTAYAFVSLAQPSGQPFYPSFPSSSPESFLLFFLCSSFYFSASFLNCTLYFYVSSLSVLSAATTSNSFWLSPSYLLNLCVFLPLQLYEVKGGTLHLFFISSHLSFILSIDIQHLCQQYNSKYPFPLYLWMFPPLSHHHQALPPYSHLFPHHFHSLTLLHDINTKPWYWTAGSFTCSCIIWCQIYQHWFSYWLFPPSINTWPHSCPNLSTLSASPGMIRGLIDFHFNIYISL